MELDRMDGLKRTRRCGEFSADDAGKEVVVAGWVQRQRDLGQLIFIDLRDRTGIVQLAFDETTDRAVFEKAFGVRSEYVLLAKGKVRRRSSVNRDLPTGEVEIAVDDLRLLSRAQTPPFEILDDVGAKEELRLKYRYLDLRRPVLQRNLAMRHRIAKVARDYFDENGFLEIETPTLIKSTPEGARDYLVPSRVHPGSFFALPQSPQMYKQLLMVAGCDRYFQLARCYRDEDLRADRQPEFTQIDVEMSFVDQDDIMQTIEGLVQRLFREVLGVDLPLPLPRMTYTEAMERYGSDKPDVRFDMPLVDLSDLAKDSAFPVFADVVAQGGSVRAVTAKQAATVYTRKEIDRLTEEAKGIGAKGLAYIRWLDETPTCSFGKFLDEAQLQAILTRTGAERGDVVFFVADRKKTVLSVLGALRQTVARRLGQIPDEFRFLWITKFPFFEYDETLGQYVAMHHPFTAPMDECLDALDTAPDQVFAKAFDLVLNGVELSSGSIRITDPELQKRMFLALGLSDEEAREKFGFLIDAYRYGAPPHGGVGLGLDRLTMLMTGSDSIREVTAFPKVATSSEPMSGAPAPVDDAQLAELSIALTRKEPSDPEKA